MLLLLLDRVDEGPAGPLMIIKEVGAAASEVWRLQRYITQPRCCHGDVVCVQAEKRSPIFGAHVEGEDKKRKVNRVINVM